MKHGLKTSISLTVALLLVGAGAMAQPEQERAGPPRAAAPRAEARQAEPHPGPTGYSRVTEPPGWNARPATVDRGAYQHNFQAARSFKIGPCHRPSGWVDRRWTYGQFLPRAYWISQYVLADYWLFGLEIPPAGYEWVRVGADAILVNILDGGILQVEYGVFL